MGKMKKEPSVRYVAAGIAAETLGVSTDSLRRWAKAGKIDFMRTPGGRYRFNLDGFMASQGKARAPVAVVEPVKATVAKKPAARASSPKAGIMPETPVAPVLKPAPLPVQMDLIEAVNTTAPVVSAADLVAALMATPNPTSRMVRDVPVHMPTLGESPRRRPVIEGLEHRDME